MKACRYRTREGRGRGEGLEKEARGNEKKEEEESRESGESQRNNWIRLREKGSSAECLINGLFI